ncbi:hypothetical protein BKG82_27840 [Mycobacteroides chelonae]|uniref:Uncharacterized protein n=1 Tax=Mycobacteroides chelonae TaxID=1774 RepID=A0A1S1LGM1_MYCCH|nr:hypothetical protein [Mycobacteroides chelonae]OHU47421.1 hypothetical protein BKG82_27840 [Mycobacteroides chelonae]
MALASALTTGVGGTATTVLPGLERWPSAAVFVVVAAIGAIGGLVRKLLHAAVIAVSVTVALIVVDALTGGHIRSAINPESLLTMASVLK